MENSDIPVLEGDCISSEDSSDLEDIFAIKNSTSLEPRKDDFVWAEHRNLHWPALVRKVYPKKKRVSVLFVDNPYRTFNLPYKKIATYRDLKVSQQIIEKANKSSMKVLHERTRMNLSIYMYKTIIGENINPIEYFKKLISEQNKITVPKICSVGVASSSRGAISSRMKGSISSQEEEIEDSSEDEIYPINKGAPELNKPTHALPNDTANDIVCCITDGYVDAHLLSIKNGKIASDYQNKYLEAMKKNKRNLLNEVTPSELINDLSKLRAISTYLKELYWIKIGTEDPNMLLYITSVWLPEAINKALSLIKSLPISLPGSSKNNPTEEWQVKRSKINSLLQKPTYFHSNFSKALHSLREMSWDDIVDKEVRGDSSNCSLDTSHSLFSKYGLKKCTINLKRCSTVSLREGAILPEGEVRGDSSKCSLDTSHSLFSKYCIKKCKINLKRCSTVSLKEGAISPEGGSDENNRVEESDMTLHSKYGLKRCSVKLNRCSVPFDTIFFSQKL